MVSFIFFLIAVEFILCAPYCEKGLNHCSICNPMTKLCARCDKEVFIPDENGGCVNSKNCKIGQNSCFECNKEESLCTTCEEGYFPDENGGCSYTDNCEVSYKGKCIQCKKNFIFVGTEDTIQICKSLNSEDLINCESIDTEKGVCKTCKKGYFLNNGDKRCSKTEHCSESSVGICRKCADYYYLNKDEEKCLNQTQNLQNCKESITGTKCDKCNDNFYLTEEGQCTYTNYCSKGVNKCDKCVSGYYLSEDNICTTEEKCYRGQKDIGICLECKDGFVMDFKDGKCKSNEKDDELKYCKTADGVCKECLKNYYLGEDNKCSTSKNCSESKNGVCLQCSDNFYLGLDNKCTNIEHCIYSDNYFNCEECEGDYCFNEAENKCFKGEGKLENCKYSYFGNWCTRCKDDYYLNQTDFICRSNSEPGDFYKCAKTFSGIEMCSECIKDYYLGFLDHKCSKIKGCVKSENENKCLECSESYSLDLKTGQCEPNKSILIKKENMK